MAQIDSGLTSFESAYAERLHRWQQMAIQKIAENLRLAGPERIIAAASLNLPTLELSNDLIQIRTRIANFGRGQITEELRRQS